MFKCAENIEDLYGPYIIRGRSIDLVWKTYVSKIIEQGFPVITEDKQQKTRETLCCISHLTDWKSGRIVPRNYVGLSPEVIRTQYLPQYLSGEKGDHTYTYGWCVRKRFGFDQTKLAVEQLKTSRTAFAQLWNPIEDLNSANPPCVDIALYYNDFSSKKLHMIAYIRSNDMGRAHSDDVAGLYETFLRYDGAFNLYGAQKAAGTLTTISGSAHIYDTSIPELQENLAGSATLANENQPLNTTTLPGPILFQSRNYQSFLSELETKFKKYSRENNGSFDLFFTVRIDDLDSSDFDSSQTMERLNENISSPLLDNAIRNYQGVTDEGNPSSINQIELLSKKLRTAPQSRRMILAPNSPSQRVYSLNPIIVQFLYRLKKLYMIAVFSNYSLIDISRAVILVKGLQNEVLKGIEIAAGPIIFLFMPGTNKAKNLSLD
ncbi:MAG: thymidylate synthase [Promethearchaeota archaeon]